MKRATLGVIGAYVWDYAGERRPNHEIKPGTRKHGQPFQRACARLTPAIQLVAGRFQVW